MEQWDIRIHKPFLIYAPLTSLQTVCLTNCTLEKNSVPFSCFIFVSKFNVFTSLMWLLGEF